MQIEIHNKDAIYLSLVKKFGPNQVSLVICDSEGFILDYIAEITEHGLYRWKRLDEKYGFPVDLSGGITLLEEHNMKGKMENPNDPNSKIKIYKKNYALDFLCFIPDNWYMAMDETGVWWAYAEKPKKNDKLRKWMSQSYEYPHEPLCLEDFNIKAASHWKDSLIQNKVN
jgi:hypothetical protein